MDFVSIINILDDTLLSRNCIMFKDNILMQKTINYNSNSTFTININEQTFNNINQAIFINKNDSLYLYLVSEISINNLKTDEFPIENINSIGVTI